MNYSQGLKKNGGQVDAERSDSDNALEYEDGRNVSNFFSLGFDGWMTFEFECPIANGEGNDIKVIEDIWGRYPLEKAEVYISEDGENWVYLGEADNTNAESIHTTNEFDLDGLMSVRYIKVVDTTDPAIHNGNADGYDFNAIQALQDCIGVVQEETA